ncbi:septum site-determining protein MinC [Anaerobacillus arseniciselenatis]|uniref:Probable septum site-determining protein MinC n=1 Tax=Anaerobacillus arseniciselenatis TaxID=85682 RepID=A0A1S2LFH9_9BACI|nr:septum site-determining protein MinC [Anaerobacillus arseniciselenatis]OIJ10265.1 septum site-determining protein MinC [Anaerobacillus arseniciselenatis]
MQKTNYVTVRGTKEGLILYLNDECSFPELVNELEEKLSSKYSQTREGPAVEVKVSVGNRYLTEEQTEQIKTVINDRKNLVINTIDSNVITKEDAESLRKEAQTSTVVKVIRSGQVLQIQGDLLLLGDVNPGGTVMATGNIYVMGVLRGIAHAGCDGNEDSVITASKMEPSQLRIAEVVNRSPDTKDNEVHEMECAYIGKDNKIAIERVQHMGKLRPKITNV